MSPRKLFLSRIFLGVLIFIGAANAEDQPIVAPAPAEEVLPKEEDQPVKPIVEQPPAPAVIEEEQPAEPIKEPEVELSPEIKQMQAIEPGFIPKDDRAVQLFLLQKAVADNDEALKKKMGERTATRELFTRKFREDLALLMKERADMISSKLESSVDEVIARYEDALKHHENNPTFAPDAMYRLGYYYFLKDEKDYFEKLAIYNDAREKGREDVPYPEENFNRTIDLYEKLIDRYPDYKNSDSVYYLLALALWYEGAFYNSVDRFQQLIAKYPKSRYVEEVWFRLGEYFYDMNDYDDAVEAYRHVINNPKSALYDKAIYKTAWSHYQKDRYAEAIDDFVRVLELTYKDKGEGASSAMRAEVTRYIVRSMAEQLLIEEGNKAPKPKPKVEEKPPVKGEAPKVPPKVSEAEKEYAEKMGVKLANRVIAFLKDRKNPPYSRDVLIETASQLLDETKVDGAVLAFERSIALDRKNQDNPRIASQIVDILQENDRLTEAREKNERLIRTYGRQSRWFKSHEGNYLAQSYALEAVRDAMLALAVYHHKTGKELKEAKDIPAAQDHFKRAAALYSRYVREYPERDDTYKAIFYMAEADFELNRYRLALETYQLLKDYPLPMADDTRRDATLSIVFTFRHVLENEAKRKRFKEIDFDALTSKSRGTEPEEIPELGQKYLKAIDDFLVIAPEDEQVPVLLFHAAAIYYIYGQIDEAESRFYFIIDKYPKSRAASVAARLIIDDAVAKEDWARVADLARRFKEQDLGGVGGEFSRIESTARFKLARSVYEQANELQKNNQLAEAKAKFKESAALFAVLLTEDPQSPHADVMIFNSARAHELSGASMLAIPLYKKIYKDYPGSDFAKSARFQEALILEKMLKFSDAAQAYDGIIKQDPKSETAGDAMLNKALLYEAAGDFTNASASFVEFAKRYPERDEAADAYLSAAGIYKKMGKTNQQIGMLEQFIKQYRRDASKLPAVIEAHVQIADTYTDLERKAIAPAQKKNYDKLRRDHYRSAVELYSPDLNSPVAAFFAAKALLILEKPEQESFKNLTINAKLGKAQSDQLTTMMKRLAELSAKNEAIIRNYAQPVWNAEALRRIGALYEHLAKTMLRAPCPRDVASVDEFACDEYMVLLEDKAAVLEQKALDAYKQAYEIAMTAYDSPPELIANILAGLNRLRPGEYHKAGSFIDQPGPVGRVYGQGRMLSTGNMASSLHPQEVDPDIKKPEPKEEEAGKPVEEEIKGEESPEEEPTEEEEAEEELSEEIE